MFSTFVATLFGSRRVQRLLVAACLGVLVGLPVCFMGQLVLSHYTRARLVRIDPPQLASLACAGAGTGTRSAPALKFSTEWIVEADPIGVLNTFVQLGWEPTTHMTTNIKLLPTQSTTVHLGLAQVRVLRGASLRYAERGSTRVVLPTSIVICLP